ncbi:MAG: UDP-3-O-(3-hydroxymyristoyl)glucosamine N-acyltransferase [Pseudolabrys sp.]|nr:UDP-3-O-(3-hydroxymyristoyl)glucosamine N-acyltransferase [Pseudolabrys sp.]
MTEPLFLRQSRGLSVAEIAALTGAQLPAGSPQNLPNDRLIRDIATLDQAGPSDITFIDNSKYLGQLAATRAGACLASERFAGEVPAGIVVLRSPAPYRALVAVASALFPDALRPRSLTDNTGVSPRATIDASARLEDDIVIDAGAVIGPRVEIGSGTVIGANAVIGADVRIGRDCAIGPAASLSHALVGDRVIMHGGVRIGQDGFGYLPGPKGHQKVPQVGRVIVQNDVEIGANTTIDRGAMRDTVIGEGSKIDNLVQIGHNVTLGRHCIIVSQTGISGSTVLGDYVVMGGQVGVGDHLTVGDGAQIGARGGVMSNVPAGARWAGMPAEPGRDWLRGVAKLRQLTRKNAKGEQGAEE